MTNRDPKPAERDTECAACEHRIQVTCGCTYGPEGWDAYRTAEVDALLAERDRLRLDKARHMARGAVLAQLCSYLARNGQWVLANEWLARGDAAMADVRPEDLVRIAMPPKREKETP